MGVVSVQRTGWPPGWFVVEEKACSGNRDWPKGPPSPRQFETQFVCLKEV